MMPCLTAEGKYEITVFALNRLGQNGSEPFFLNFQPALFISASCCTLPTLPNGRIIANNASFESTISFSCNVGHTLVGEATAACTANRTWSLSTPTCVKQATAQTMAQIETKVIALTDGGINVALDLIFVMGTSASITRRQFDKSLKPFPITFARHSTVSPLPTNVGAIAFGYNIHVISNLTDRIGDFNLAVSKFVYKNGGGTNTGQALLRAIEMFKISGRSMTYTKRIVILVTDGYRNMGPSIAATVEELKKNAIEVFAFGIGSDVNEVELHALASPPSDRHVFVVRSFRLFRYFTLSIVSRKNEFTLDLQLIKMLSNWSLCMTEPIREQCGVSGFPGFHPRIYGGDKSAYGTLINNRWIVTAAHCIYNERRTSKEIVRVQLGKQYLYLKNPHEQTYTANVSTAIMKRYNPFMLDNDFALLRLDKNVTFNRFVRPICLYQDPIYYQNSSNVHVGRRVIVIGWGRYSSSHLALSPVLREATVTIQNNSQCDRLLGYRKLTDSMLCARGNKEDACYGDSGGPMMCQDVNTNRFFLCGIISFGFSAACVAGHGVYTKLTKFVPSVIIPAVGND
ncbi:complement C2-like isoform X3 [Corticium candelabrum]|uniref:complement C2-like isoform X3 n=1 Tax=Corticium candelabrum TaxID=121492 RepID=UPI002E2769F8|nr:complement C2-like isoform X3 [Corticium candelabrum]